MSKVLRPDGVVGPLSGRVALVTGARRGIGRAICVGLAAAGASVVVNYRTGRADAQEVIATIEAGGGSAIAVRADVSDAAQVRALVDDTMGEFGRLDILVNNAALTRVHQPWLQISERDWDRVQATNLKSCFLCARAAYPHLKSSRRGRIINISSVTVWVGKENLLHYISSKAGMIGFTRALAREVGRDGITVNAVTPGAVQTEVELEMFPDQRQVKRRTLQRQALRRRGIPQDIVGAVVLLASDAGSFISGQTINVDGGWAMH